MGILVRGLKFLELVAWIFAMLVVAYVVKGVFTMMMNPFVGLTTAILVWAVCLLLVAFATPLVLVGFRRSVLATANKAV
ncbi:hypothetical protein DFR27_2513 [Umboniibacter marinipuniceus]|uniref:Uncharacterized protein n=1 Tax=Umboniibacter marinipuniceus TaxID=569599 RepID=A0A3M0AE93_9GAMM|nr:hypothetical protein DFR27_2513 [Umboniibacter marinipuniceus]